MESGLQRIAKKCAAAHRRALKRPEQLGEIEKIWNEGQIVCIKYSCGEWYHYTLGAGGEIVWY